METKSSAYLWDVNNPRGYGNAMGRYRTAREFAFILEYVRGKNLAILDVGGGSGRFAVSLAKRGHRVTVADISEEALKLLRERNVAGISTMHGDFLSQAFEERFDAVTAIESLQCITSVSFAELFGRIHALLKTGGWFVFTALNDRSWRYALRALRGNNLEYNVAEPGAYEAALRMVGFCDVHVEGFVWIPFTATSNSPLVPVFAAMERGLGLGRWIGQSPWLMIAAKRQ
jgi:SAM-dependent methyltransferase